MNEDSPPLSKRSRRDADLPKKAKKKTQPGEIEIRGVFVQVFAMKLCILKLFSYLESEPRKSTELKTKKGGLSQLLGKRRCAAEANERMALAGNQVCLMWIAWSQICFTGI